jgi:hypothetical protein
LLGRSTRSLRASGAPTTTPWSLRPMTKVPPSALAKPQIHFRYSSRHDSFYSMFWFSFIWGDFVLVMITHRPPSWQERLRFKAPNFRRHHPDPLPIDCRAGSILVPRGHGQVNTCNHTCSTSSRRWSIPNFST